METLPLFGIFRPYDRLLVDARTGGGGAEIAFQEHADGIVEDRRVIPPYFEGRNGNDVLAFDFSRADGLFDLLAARDILYFDDLPGVGYLKPFAYLAHHLVRGADHQDLTEFFLL